MYCICAVHILVIVLTVILVFGVRPTGTNAGLRRVSMEDCVWMV